MDLTILLSRIQFGFTIGFHILFPTFNIGLAVFLSIMEGIWLKKQDPAYLKICQFWTKIFALTFGMGVVSGVVMSYELGTNFGIFTAAAGGVLGPLFGFEVMSAFFLEAGFLGVMLFGWKRVGPKLHYAATIFVTVGTLISAFWIMAANSWMQTPAGFHMVAGKFAVTSWSDVIFNPSFLRRFIHMIFAALVTTCFVIAGISAWYLLKQRALTIAKPCFSFALAAALFLTPAQIILGDIVGEEVFQHQPLKTAAIEGNWNTMPGAPLILLAYPDVTHATNLYPISIPYVASILNTHHVHGVLLGLNSTTRDNWPVVLPVFYGFRVMAGIGFLFFAVTLWGLWLRFRKKLFESRGFQTICVLISPLGFVATIAGWLTAESGRQPWIIYNLMRTKDAASAIPVGHVLISLIVFILIYSIIFAFYLYYLFKFIKKGTKDLDEPPVTVPYLAHPKGDTSVSSRMK